MFKRFFLLFSFLNLGLNTNANALNSSKVNHLREQLLRNYRSDTIPNNGEPLDLKMGLAMRAFNNINQIDGTVELNVWLRYWWNDYNLVWNKNKWNISSLTFRTEPGIDGGVWTPDIYLYNTAENPLENLKYSNLEVDNDGNIIWSRPGIIKVTCAFDLTNFPYDKQRCQIKLGSWTYNGFQLVLNEGFPPIDIENYQPNEEWRLDTINHTINAIKYACCPYEYYDITFEIYIKRLAGYYETNIIIPTFATASLILVTLMIPWDSGERISFAVTVMLSIIVFLLLLSDTLPKSNQRPLLSKMITGLTFFALFGVLFTVLISALNDYKDKLDETKEKIESTIIRNLFYMCNWITGNKYRPCDLIDGGEGIDGGEFNTSSNSNKTNNLRTLSYLYAMEEEEDIVPVRKRTNIIHSSKKENTTTYSNRKYDGDYNTLYTNNKELIKNNENNENNRKPKKTQLQKQCDNMINILEYIYSICFFIVFITLCIIMVVSRFIYN